jgi:hypothetical protein
MCARDTQSTTRTGVHPIQNKFPACFLLSSVNLVPTATAQKHTWAESQEGGHWEQPAEGQRRAFGSGRSRAGGPLANLEAGLRSSWRITKRTCRFPFPVSAVQSLVLPCSLRAERVATCKWPNVPSDASIVRHQVQQYRSF